MAKYVCSRGKGKWRNSRKNGERNDVELNLVDNKVHSAAKAMVVDVAPTTAPRD
jgi:hypothetical protein